MLINTFLDTEDFVHLYYPEDEPPAAAQGCGAGARMASKYPPRPPSPAYSEYSTPSTSNMTERERYRSPPQPEPPPHRVRAADLYPRVRTQYDEPGLDIGFTPICGEFVQWVSRTAAGGTIAISNYRLHLQPRRRSGHGSSVPVRLIDYVDVQDPLHLVIMCKNGRHLKCKFESGEKCMEWYRQLNIALAPIESLQSTFAAAYAAWAKEQPTTSVHRQFIKASQESCKGWFQREVDRLGLISSGVWRVTTANANYTLCPTYPPQLVVPACIPDEDLDSIARFRAMRRIPAVVWRYRGNGAVIARSSQPEVGWFGWRSSEDERLLAAFVTACISDSSALSSNTRTQPKLLIIDARSYTSAVTNRARGGGCECQQYYPMADIQFMSLPNIHNVRKSFQQLCQLMLESSDQPNWHSKLEGTLWLPYLSGLLRTAFIVMRAILVGKPVLVHCSDGWDRTPQIVAAAQLLLDPYYRTLEGFRILIEREWLDFGHKFAERCGHRFGPDEPNERSPIFLQWLDMVHQLMEQFPCSFEFNEAYLIKLATHVHSCMFGTFLCNTALERSKQGVNETTGHVWQLLNGPAYRNHLYTPPQKDKYVLWVDYNPRCMRFWWAMFVGDREHPGDDYPEADVLRMQSGAVSSSGLTKTRSCDNLLTEAEKRTVQRRSSDPSLAPDVMRLSALGVGDNEVSRDSRALTDSCVDELGALPARAHAPAPASALVPTIAPTLAPAPAPISGDQVNAGLDPDHFETARLSRDIASGSSSLERELGGAAEQADELVNTNSADTTDNISPVAGPSRDIEDSVKTSVTDAIDPVRPETSQKSDTNVAITDNSVQKQQSVNVINVSSSAHNTTESVVKLGTSPDTDTPEDQAVIVNYENYNDVFGVAEAARESGRLRNISITWRSLSESSNQSLTGFDLPDGPNRTEITSVVSDNSQTNSHESSPLDNCNSTEGDIVNHNVPLNQVNSRNDETEQQVVGNDVDEEPPKFLEVDLNNGGTCSTSSASSESEGEAERRHARARGASQLTLCPASPRRARAASAVCCHCARRASATSGMETSCESGASSETCCCGACAAGACAAGAGGGGGAGARARCVCGGAGPAARADSLDGLPPAVDPLQARLHQIILYQKKIVQELNEELREAREALRRISPSPANAIASARVSPSAPSPTQMSSSSVSARGSGSASGSSSGSASEVEVGEEARGVVWLPDSAAQRCQYCSNHFWLARRRHHCRRCGGIFCGSCSEMSSWGNCGSIRVCRACRALALR